jgi:hypothetical protein
MLKGRVDAIEQNLDIKIGEIIADRGYGSADNLNFLEERGIRSNIPLWSGRTGETFFKEVADGFKINDDATEVYCPAGNKMIFSAYHEHSNRFMFMLPRSVCKSCPRFTICLTENEQTNRGKRFAIPSHHRLIKTVFDKSKESLFKTKMWQRMWKMEGIFAEGKNNHGLRRARYRGRAKVQIQVYTISTVQNLKRLATAIGDDFTTFTSNLAKKYFWSTETSFFAVIHRKNVEILI